MAHPPHLARRTGPRAALGAFGRDERGVITIVAMFFFVMMVLASGVAIDFMRVETERTRLQYTLDRGVLAAASLRQEADPATVVEDYLRAEGLNHHSVEVTPEDDGSGTYRRVAARSTGTIDSLFLHMLGVDRLTVPASSEAEERTQKIELSLVLDVSGSMNDPSGDGSETRIEALRRAARNFVSEMLADRPEAVSISVVSYNNQVNIGGLSRYFELDRWHALASCAEFPAAEFATTAIAPGARLRQVGHGQMFLLKSGDFSDPPGATTSHCAIDRTIPLVWTNDETRLHDHIDAFTAFGGTSIDLGIKWGAALLDPASQGRLSAMVAAGDVASDFDGRPAAFDDETTLKVLVVMTDGEITRRYDMHRNRQDGLSGVYAWRSDFAGMSQADRLRAILADDGTLTFSIRDRNDSAVFYQASTTDDPVVRRSAPVGEGDAVELTYMQLWSIKATWYVGYIMAWNMPSATRNWYRNASYETFNEVAGDSVPDSFTNLRAICTAAKNRGIKVFTIGFLVAAKGADEMRDCASGASNFYDVQTGDLQNAFDQIARVLTQLTLSK